MSPAVETGLAVVLALGLIEALKIIRTQVQTRKNGGKKANACGLTGDQARQLQRLHDLHDRTDPDGTPVWYVPRQALFGMRDGIRDLAAHQEDQTSLLREIRDLLRSNSRPT